MKIREIVSSIVIGGSIGIGSVTLATGATILCAGTKNPLIRGVIWIGTGVSAFGMGYVVNDLLDLSFEAMDAIEDKLVQKEAEEE